MTTQVIHPHDMKYLQGKPKNLPFFLLIFKTLTSKETSLHMSKLSLVKKCPRCGKMIVIINQSKNRHCSPACYMWTRRQDQKAKELEEREKLENLEEQAAE